MLSKKELKELSHTCAYCGKELRDNNKTVDHVLPQCAGGKNETDNLVICCYSCNLEKANQDINTFLDVSTERINNFYDYLISVDKQTGNKNYSEDILKNISSNPYHFKKERTNRKKYKKSSKTEKVSNSPIIRHNRIITYESENIEYFIHGVDITFKSSGLQNIILDFYIHNPGFTEYNILVQFFDIQITQILNCILQSDNISDLFLLKSRGFKGIMRHDLYYKYCNIDNIL
ncbi:MAG: HNH endonuclease [Candidatus Gastranaerophilales bacterium]|nr:HNH endonuclease [Candidatus Gastranaerophilales bacterium]